MLLALAIIGGIFLGVMFLRLMFSVARLFMTLAIAVIPLVAGYGFLNWSQLKHQARVVLLGGTVFYVAVVLGFLILSVQTSGGRDIQRLPDGSNGSDPESKKKNFPPPSADLK